MEQENPATPKHSRKLTKEEKELKEIHRKYHPQENDNSLKVNDEYKKKLEKLFYMEIK